MALAALGSAVQQLWVMSTVKSALKRCQNGGEEGAAPVASPVGRIDAACGLTQCAARSVTHTHTHLYTARLRHKTIKVFKKKTSPSAQLSRYKT